MVKNIHFRNGIPTKFQNTLFLHLNLLLLLEPGHGRVSDLPWLHLFHCVPTVGDGHHTLSAIMDCADWRLV